MGRPLNKKFFGNRNVGTTGTTDNGIGGEGVASITVTGTFSGKTTATPYAVTISAPQIPNGVQATATITFSSATAGTVTVTEKGSGYTTVPTATCALGGGTGNPTLTPVLTVDTGNVGSATNQENAILMTARLTGGSAVTVDIIRQVSGRRYKVTDGTRTGIVTLKASVATTAGEGSVRLVDTDGDTYFATKLTAHKATITRGTGVQAAFVTGSAVQWNMTAATATSLLIDNA